MPLKLTLAKPALPKLDLGKFTLAKLTLERYAQIGFALAGLTIAVAGLSQYSAVTDLLRDGHWADHTSQVIQEITATRLAVKTGESAARGYVLTGDDAFLQAVTESLTSSIHHEQQLRLLTADNPRQHERLDRLEPQVARRFEILDELIRLRRNEGLETVEAFAQQGTGATLSASIEALSIEIQNEEYALLKGRRESLENSSTRAVVFGWVAALVSLGLLGGTSVIIHYDIQRRRKLQKELGHEKYLFSSLMDTVPSSVYFKDADGRYLRVNAAMGRQLRLSSAAEAVGKHDSDFYSPRYVELTRAREKEILETGRPDVETEELQIRKDGEQIWVMSTRLPLFDEQGTIAGVFGFARDITASKDMDEALETANSKLTAWNAQLELRNQETMLLGEMGELLQTCVNEAEADKILTQFAYDLCPGLSGALYMIKASRNQVERTASWSEVSALATMYSPVDCWALRRGRAHGSGSANDRIKCAHIAASFTGSFVCVPMMAHGETLGVLHLLRHDGQDLDKSQLRMAKMIAERMALAIANLRLRDALKAQSIRDPLTGLFNRRYLEESLDRELHRAHRHRMSVGAMMLDVDHFKQFNDTFGHDGGDAVLKKLSEMITGQTREEDIVCRYGGEEFLIILPGASLDDVRSRGEMLLEAIRGIEVISRGRPLGPVTASIGVAVYPDDATSMSGLIRVADEALYRAKASGRDCLKVAATSPVG